MARARILAHPDVVVAVENLSELLSGAGFTHEVTTRSVRVGVRKKKAAGPALVEPGREAAE
jgi:hypothetical protein